MVAVYIVEHVDEGVGREAVQGDDRGAPGGRWLLILTEVVVQQGPEVVAAATEEGLGEAGDCEGLGAGAGAGPGRQKRLGTLWQRKLQSATRKHTSGQLLKLSGQGKGSSPRSP